MRRTTRTVTGATLVLALTACSAAVGTAPGSAGPTAAGGTTAAPSSVSPSPSSDERTFLPELTSYRVARSVPVPGDGPIAYAGGLLWAVDRKSLSEDAQGRIDGDLWGVDPRSGRVTARVTHARGGFPVVGFGSLWLVNAEYGETVLRLDLRTRRTTRFRTSSGADPAPEALAVAGGALWVANNHEGTVVEVDPRTLTVLRTIEVVPGTDGGVRGHATADGRYVWMPSDADSSVVRIDTRTATIVSRFALPTTTHPSSSTLDPGSLSQPEWLELVDGRLWIACPDHVLVVDVSQVGAEHVVADIPMLGTFPSSLALSPDSVFATSGDPASLIRIDRRSLRVLGRIELGGGVYTHGSAPYPAVVDDRVWVRLSGRVVELAPTTGT